jgi:hypothetical protein
MTVLGCSIVLGAVAVSAADDSIKHLDQHFTGDRVVGAPAIRLIGNNPLTQNISVDVVATAVTPQPLPNGINPNPAPTGTPAASPAPKNVAVTTAKRVHGEALLDVVQMRTLRCDVDNEVIQDAGFFEQCAGAAADTALAVPNTAAAALATAERAVSAFRADSDRAVASSGAVHDDSALGRYKLDVAGVINGNGSSPGKVAVDRAVSATWAWPKADADKARLAVARYTSLVDNVAKYDQGRKAALKRRLSDADAAVNDDARTAYNDRRKAASDARDRIDGLSVTSYVAEVSSSCNGLFGKGVERKITVTVTPIGATAPAVTDDITAICPPKSFVSTGFTFASGGDRTFGTVAPNAAVAPAPGSSAPPNVIVETTRSDVHAASISFVNFRVGGNPRKEDGIYASFGVIVGTGGNSSADFAGGVSYAFAKSFVLTAGGFLGSQTQLAPGYTVGGPIAANVTNPPTTTTRKIRPFVGVSFNL